MSEFYKQPLILDDQPAKYEDFSGGINNDRNNENIKRNQLREALNTHYDNGDLTKRLGAEVFKNLIYNDSDPDRHRNIVQGVFTFVGAYAHYLIVQRDGFIYYSTLGESNTLNMIEIPIIINDNKAKYDATNLTIGLEKYIVNPGDNKWEVIPDLLLDNDGYLLQEAIITGEDEDKVDDKYLSGIYIPATTRLILQNYRTVQSAVFNDTLYMATGTRFLKIFE